MRKQIVFLLIMLVCLFACATPVVQDIHLSRLGDLESNKYNIIVDKFGSGEIPAVVVSGFAGHNVKIRIVDLATGKVVETRKDYMADNWIKWWWFNNLPVGNYQVVLLVGGDIKKKVNFSITK